MNIDQIPIDTLVKVHFKEHDRRFTMIGIFVNTSDAKEMGAKNLIRFVNQSKLDFWERNPNINLTKLYRVSDFRFVVVEKNSTHA